MTAGLPSQTVLKWLNEYFTEMDNIIRAHGGLLNKFIGDGLLVVYGVPLSRGLQGGHLRGGAAPRLPCCAGSKS